MIYSIKLELKRAFFNKNYLVALAIGVIVAVTHFATQVIPQVGSLNNYMLGKGEYPLSVFNTWIGGESWSSFALLFNTLIPIICTIPFVDSFYMDNKTGYTKNLLIREKQQNYFISKFISVFVSSGTVAVIPLLLNLFLTATVMPALIPDASAMTFSLNASCMLSELFYTHPFLYILIYMIIIFMYAGLLSIIGLVVSFLAENRIFVTLFPFMFYILTDYILEFIGASGYSIRYMLRIDQPKAVSGDKLILVYVILMSILIAIYHIKAKNYETL